MQNRKSHSAYQQNEIIKDDKKEHIWQMQQEGLPMNGIGKGFA